MEFLFKKTTELTDYEKNAILSLFNEIFNKDRSIYEFTNQYVNNVLGYSYHTLVLEKGILIAHAAYVPAFYYIAGVNKIVVDGIDGMISKNYRDSSVLLDLIQFNRDNLIKSGAQIEIGFPNSYAMKVYSKGKLYKKVGEMSIYALPFRLGGIKPNLRFINIFSILFCRTYVVMVGLFAKRRETKYLIEKDVESYNVTRYKRMDGIYSRVQMDDFEFIYKVIEHEGIRTAFLIDVTKKSARNFNIALRYIIKHNKKEFDLLLYVGNLPFKCHGMIKIPQRFKPKEFNFAIKILDKSLQQETLMNMDNWDLNLSNFDLI